MSTNRIIVLALIVLVVNTFVSIAHAETKKVEKITYNTAASQERKDAIDRRQRKERRMDKFKRLGQWS